MSVLDKFFFEIFSSRRAEQAEKDATKQKVMSFQEIGQKRKMVIKIEFNPLLPLSLSRLQNVSLEKCFKNTWKEKYCIAALSVAFGKGQGAEKQSWTVNLGLNPFNPVGHLWPIFRDRPDISATASAIVQKRPR